MTERLCTVKTHSYAKIMKSNRAEKLLCFGFFLVSLILVIVLHRVFHHNKDGDNVIIKTEVGNLYDKTRASSPHALLCCSTYYKDLIISQRHR